MKHLMILMPLLCSLASAQTIPTWAELLQPTLEARQQACNDAIAYEQAHPTPAGQKYVQSNDDPKLLLGSYLTDKRPSPPETKVPQGTVNNIQLQLPLRTAAIQCGNAAKAGKTSVDLSHYLSSTIIYIQSEVKLLKDALKNTAILRLLDKDGHELARMDSPALETKADQALWTRTCQEGTCLWRGFSVFRFSDYQLKPNVYQATQTLQLVYDRGFGPETREYQASDFTQLTLSDPAKK